MTLLILLLYVVDKRGNSLLFSTCHLKFLLLPQPLIPFYPTLRYLYIFSQPQAVIPHPHLTHQPPLHDHFKGFYLEQPAHQNSDESNKAHTAIRC